MNLPLDTDTNVEQLIARRRRGFSLSQPFYTDEGVFRLDLERVFRRRWLFAGLTCQIRKPGDYFTFDVGGDSLVVIRGDDLPGDVALITIRPVWQLSDVEERRTKQLEVDYELALAAPTRRTTAAREPSVQPSPPPVKLDRNDPGCAAGQ